MSYKWRNFLTSESIKTKYKATFCKELLGGGKNHMYASKEGNTAEVRKLLSFGVDVHSVDKDGRKENWGEEDGWTPLHYAAGNGKKDEVKLLLRGGADPDKTDRWGRTALHCTASKGHKDVVQHP